jgi:hypothetical protein
MTILVCACTWSTWSTWSVQRCVHDIYRTWLLVVCPRSFTVKTNLICSFLVGIWYM